MSSFTSFEQTRLYNYVSRLLEVRERFEIDGKAEAIKNFSRLPTHVSQFRYASPDPNKIFLPGSAVSGTTLDHATGKAVPVTANAARFFREIYRADLDWDKVRDNFKYVGPGNSRPDHIRRTLQREVDDQALLTLRDGFTPTERKQQQLLPEWERRKIKRRMSSEASRYFESLTPRQRAEFLDIDDIERELEKKAEQRTTIEAAKRKNKFSHPSALPAIRKKKLGRKPKKPAEPAMSRSVELFMSGREQWQKELVFGACQRLSQLEKRLRWIEILGGMKKSSARQLYREQRAELDNLLNMYPIEELSQYPRMQFADWPTVRIAAAVLATDGYYYETTHIKRIDEKLAHDALLLFGRYRRAVNYVWRQARIDARRRSSTPQINMSLVKQRFLAQL